MYMNIYLQTGIYVYISAYMYLYISDFTLVQDKITVPM